MRASLGISLAELTAEIRRQLRLPDTVRGVVISGVSPASDAAAQGLQRGDVILSINQRQTTTSAEAAAAVDAARGAGRDTVLMLVQRGATPPTFIGVDLVGGQSAGG